MKEHQKFWHALLGAWLKSIGCKILTGVYCDHCAFSYEGQQYQYWVGRGVMDIGDRPDREWAGIDLNTNDVDVCDPSFDPDKFFTPFKEWLVRTQ